MPCQLHKRLVCQGCNSAAKLDWLAVHLLMHELLKDMELNLTIMPCHSLPLHASAETITCLLCLLLNGSRLICRGLDYVSQWPAGQQEFHSRMARYCQQYMNSTLKVTVEEAQAASMPEGCSRATTFSCCTVDTAVYLKHQD